VQGQLAAIAIAAVVGIAGCGGGGAAAGEPLVSGSPTGEFKGQAFTPKFGVATVYKASNLIALGDGPVNCTSAQQNDPPAGTTVVFEVPMLAVGSYSSVFVDFVQSIGRNFSGAGSADGTVMLTAVGATSVAGHVAYSFTDPTDQSHYAVSGDFEVVRCPM
jgi:hypothetical protein